MSNGSMGRVSYFLDFKIYLMLLIKKKHILYHNTHELISIYVYLVDLQFITSK